MVKAPPLPADDDPDHVRAAKYTARARYYARKSIIWSRVAIGSSLLSIAILMIGRIFT